MLYSFQYLVRPFMTLFPLRALFSQPFQKHIHHFRTARFRVGMNVAEHTGRVILFRTRVEK